MEPNARPLYVDRRISEEQIRITIALTPDSFHTNGAGHLHAYRTRSVGSCAGAVRALGRRLGLDEPAVFEVRDAAVGKALHHRGLGVWMYAEAARLAWLCCGAFLTASECTDGGTSPQALRVWAGRRFGVWTEIEGEFTAVWRDRRPSRVPPAPQAPDGFKLVDVEAESDDPLSALALRFAMSALWPESK